MSDISKEELHAMIEVQTKNTEHLVTIATHLQTLVETQGKIIARLYNGMGKDIQDGVRLSLNESFKVVKEVHTGQDTKLDSINGKITKLFIIFGSVALIVALGTATMQIIHWLGHFSVAVKPAGL